MIKFSIITASYNSDKTITATFDSLLNQSYVEPFEYIVIDGASSDKTVDIIKEYEAKFLIENIIFKWISEPDQGIYYAWNKGLKLVEGSWIAFLGSDDRLRKEALAVYWKNIQNHQEYDLFHAPVSIYNNGNHVRTSKSKFSGSGLFLNVAHTGAFHSKRLFEKNEEYDLDYKISSDYEFILRAGEIKHFFIDQVLVEMGDGGVSSTYRTHIEKFRIRLNTKKFPKSLAIYNFVLSSLRFFVAKSISFIFGKSFIPKLKVYINQRG